MSEKGSLNGVCIKMADCNILGLWVAVEKW